MSNLNEKFMNDIGLQYFWGRIRAMHADKATTEAALAGKVDKIPGMGLSETSFTASEKTKLQDLPTASSLATSLSNKVDKVNGMGLSQNSYTTTEKNKLAGLPDAVTYAADLDAKVDKISGYGLSQNNYTSTEKTKLANIATEAQVNVIEVVRRNGTALPISSKAVDITVPTQTSQLTNNSTWQTKAQIDALIAAAIGTITSFEFRKVDTLPATGEAGVVYLVLEDSSTGDVYNEYAWVDNQWEKLGSMNLEGYWNDENLVPITTAEIDALTAV